MPVVKLLAALILNEKLCFAKGSVGCQRVWPKDASSQARQEEAGWRAAVGSHQLVCTFDKLRREKECKVPSTALS
jgi:hypothetical protein